MSGFAVGDRVAYTATGTYASHVAVDPLKAVKLPDSTSFNVGASMLLQGLTAIALTHNCAGVKKGDTVLVHAVAGGTGGLIGQICKRLGATVIGMTSCLFHAIISPPYC